MPLELGECYSKSRIVDLINRLFRINVLFPDVREPTLLPTSNILIRISPQAVPTYTTTDSKLLCTSTAF